MPCRLLDELDVTWGLFKWDEAAVICYCLSLDTSYRDWQSGHTVDRPKASRLGLSAHFSRRLGSGWRRGISSVLPGQCAGSAFAAWHLRRVKICSRGWLAGWRAGGRVVTNCRRVPCGHFLPRYSKSPPLCRNVATSDGRRDCVNVVKSNRKDKAKHSQHGLSPADVWTWRIVPGQA